MTGSTQSALPGVLVPCGHSTNSKASKVEQQACTLLALNGIVALIVDPIDQGERIQWIDNDGHAQQAVCLTKWHGKQPWLY